MSSDRRPAKVRVVSSGPIRSATGAVPASTPARRRTDEPTEAIVPPAPVREGVSLLWIAGALGLFLVGCAIGGALLVVSGLASAPPL
jgi:hypothetical protein